MIFIRKNDIKHEWTVFKTDMKIVIPLAILNFIFWGIPIFDRLTRIEYIVISMLTAYWIAGIIKRIYKLPSSYIIGEQTKAEKMFIHIVQFVVGNLGYYMILVGILHNYFPFFESLVCCDFVKNFSFNLNASHLAVKIQGI